MPLTNDTTTTMERDWSFTPFDNQDLLDGLISQLGATQLKSSLVSSSSVSSPPKNYYKPVGRKSKKKKQLRFSNKSTLQIYERPEKNPDLHINEHDRVRFEKDSALTIRKMHGVIRQVPPTVLKNQCQNTDSMAEGMVFLMAHNYVTSKQQDSENQVQPEEMIGLEHYLHGFDYVSSIAEKKKKVTQFVVEGWQKLQTTRQESEVQQGGDDNSVEMLDDIEERIANVYAKMTKKSVLRARRRADCVHWMNEKSNGSKSIDNSQHYSKIGKLNLPSHQLSGPLRGGNSINFRRRSKTATAA